MDTPATARHPPKLANHPDLQWGGPPQIKFKIGTPSMFPWGKHQVKALDRALTTHVFWQSGALAPTWTLWYSPMNRGIFIFSDQKILFLYLAPLGANGADFSKRFTKRPSSLSRKSSWCFRITAHPVKQRPLKHNNRDDIIKIKHHHASSMGHASIKKPKRPETTGEKKTKGHLTNI